MSGIFALLNRTLQQDSRQWTSALARAAVLLFYKQRQSCNEISEVLDMPVATVKSHLHRARAKLKPMLEPLMSEEISRDRILGELAG